MATARSHEELICWQRAYELKMGVYALMQSGPVVDDEEFCDQIRRSARSAPRLMAEGFGRYVPGEFRKYLRWANGELKETMNALRDGVDSGYFTPAQVLPLQRLARRSSKAATSLIAYLRTAKAPDEQSPPAKRPNSKDRRTHGTKRTQGTRRTRPSEPPEPFEPSEP
ncbi:MAG TPA: four helix bundle protein [Vicinamibacterales bacterium]|jgi:four helix bundle protein